MERKMVNGTQECKHTVQTGGPKIVSLILMLITTCKTSFYFKVKTVTLFSVLLDYNETMYKGSRGLWVNFFLHTHSMHYRDKSNEVFTSFTGI